MLHRNQVPHILKVEILPPSAQLSWEGGSACVRLSPSPRSRTVRAVLDECEVVVRHPHRISKRRLEDSLRALAGWIIAADQVAQARRQSLSGDSFSYAGEPTVIKVDSSLRRVVIDERGFATPSLSHLESWLKKDARRTLPPLVEDWAARMNLEVTAIRITSPRRRWGSCSSRGTISVNWRLVMAPPEVQEYLVVHELAHRREMNHSNRYWAVVEEHCPNYREHEKWLKANGWRLMSFGATQSAGKKS